MLQKRIDGAQKCIDALQSYCAEAKLKEAAYSNSQEFYIGTYIPLLSQVVYTCNEIISLNNTVLPTFSSYVPDTRGFAADTQVLEAEIERLDGEINAFNSRISQYTSLMTPT